MVAKKPHAYNVGDIVNGMRILRQTRHNTDNKRAYEVQSIKHPDAPLNIVTEYSIKNGKGCSYSSNPIRKVYPGNSLWSKAEIRPYLIDIELAKTISPHSNKPIMCKCPNCDKQKKMKPNNLVEKGFSCKICSKGLSYGEVAMASMSEYFNMGYEFQEILKDLPNRRFDAIKYNKEGIVNIVEIQGVQHYDKKHKWYEDSHKQDVDKRKWCEKNNILLIEIDMRKSTWSHFKEQVNNCEHLPYIKEEDEKEILKLIEQNQKYPIKKIIEFYKNGTKTKDISIKLNISCAIILSILKKSNVEIKQLKIKLPEKTICNKYLNGMTTYQLARKYNVSVEPIKRILKDNDISLRDGRIKLDENKICDMYTVKKMSPDEIAKIFNCGRTTVYRILERNETEMRNKGTKKGGTSLNGKPVKCIETGEIYENMYRAMEETGISNKSISSVCNGKRKTTGGYHWEFVDNE